MKKLLENWRKFELDTIKEDVLNEISQASYERIKDWLANAGGNMALSFDNLFGEDMRTAIPVGKVMSPNSDIGRLFNFLEGSGWTPDLSTGLAEKEVQTQRGPQVKRQKIGKILKQADRLHNKARKAWDKVRETSTAIRARGGVITTAAIQTNPEYQKAVSDATAAERAYNNQFPGAAMNPGREAHLLDFWNKKSQFYRENPDKIAKEYTIVVSRHPVDVLRMSDFAMIHSCHSEGSEYFHCAMAEAKGHGPVAYMVESEALETVDLQEDEIFEDEDRDVDGIEPLARIRLRRFFNRINGYDLAIPEKRTYGADIPNFAKKLKQWALEKQETLFMGAIDGDKRIDSGYMQQFVRTGGSYEDNEARLLFNEFFSEYGAKFTGRIPWEGDEDSEEDPYFENQQLAEEYEARGEAIQNYADRVFSGADPHHGFYVSYEVYHDDEMEPPVLYFSGGMTFEFELNGSAMWPTKWTEQSEIFQAIDNVVSTHEGVDDTDAYEHAGDLEVRFMFDTSYYDPSPEGFDSFVEGMRNDVGDYAEYEQAIRSVLTEKGFIEPTEIDILKKRIDDGEVQFKNFALEKSEEGGWEIVEKSPVRISTGTIRNDLYRIFNAVHKDAFRVSGMVGSNIFSRKVIDQLSQEIADATEATEKQLKLKFSPQQLKLQLGDVEKLPKPQEVKDYVLNGFRILLSADSRKVAPLSQANEPYGEYTPRQVGVEYVKFDLDDTMDSAMINSAINLVQHIDKNWQDFLKKVGVALTDADDAYMQIVESGKKDLEALRKMAFDVALFGEQGNLADQARALTDLLKDADVARIVAEKDWKTLQKRQDARRIQILLQKVKEAYQELQAKPKPAKSKSISESVLRAAIHEALLKTWGKK